MKKVASIILNRNLPKVTDKLYSHLEKYDAQQTDIFVVEAGSDENNLSKNVTWHADWEEAKKEGLRYPRGMNYGLSQLWKEGRFKDYDAFFLLTNDTELEKKPTIAPLLDLLQEHQKIGILSPCSKTWGEKLLLKDQKTKYFWFIHNTAYLVRRNFIESVVNIDEPQHMNFLFDGSNFRGYFTDTELIAKAYANDWSAAITTEVWAEENESYLLKQSDLIKTETYDENMKLYIQEGMDWIHKKYGFNSRWSMINNVKNLYDNFFKFNPEYQKYKV